MSSSTKETLVKDPLAQNSRLGGAGSMLGGILTGEFILSPTLEDIAHAQRRIESDTDYVLVNLHENSACGSYEWRRRTGDNGSVIGRASFYLAQASRGVPCCPPIVSTAETADEAADVAIDEPTCVPCDSAEIIGIDLQITESDLVPLTEEDQPLIEMPFKIPSKGIVIARAFCTANKPQKGQDGSGIEIGISKKHVISGDRNEKRWNHPSDNTKSKNRRLISLNYRQPISTQTRIDVVGGDTVISLHGCKGSGDSDSYVQGRTLFVTFIPDVDSNQRKSGDARQNYQKNK